jgi:hypothetical protein
VSAELAPDIVSCCFFTAAGGKPSWTAKLLSNPELLCKKVGRGGAVACRGLSHSVVSDIVCSAPPSLFHVSPSASF